MDEEKPGAERRDQPRNSPSRTAQSRRQQRLQSLETEIEAALARYFAALSQDMFGAHGSRRQAIECKLRLRCEAAEQSTQVRFDPPLQLQLREVLKELEMLAGIYRLGHVYCYRCESSQCEHSQPAQPAMVFSGYAYNGIPQWQEFYQILLDVGDERVDRVFARGRTLVVRFFPGRELKRKLLREFGRASKTYDLLCQLIVGLLTVDYQDNETMRSEDVAMTLQAVESRDADGVARLDLNVIGRLSTGEQVLDHLAVGRHQRIFEVISGARRQIKLLEGKLRMIQGRGSEKKSELMRQVPRLMTDAARALEHLGRQHGRKTQHAFQRVMDNRPVVSAAEDARHAPDERLMFDRETKSIVVWGPKQRIHIFSAVGVHVTSLKLGADAVHLRLKRKRWQPATAAERQTFRQGLATRYAGA